MLPLDGGLILFDEMHDPVSLFVGINFHELTDACLVQLVNEDLSHLHCLYNRELRMVEPARYCSHTRRAHKRCC